MRVDKWIWAVRMAKSRTIAATLCKGGKVKVNHDTVKASRNIKIGDIVEVSYKHGHSKKYKVVNFIEKRGSTKMAAPCFEDLTPEITEEEKLARKYSSMPIGRRKKGEGRPTKKQKRDIDELKKKFYE